VPSISPPSATEEAEKDDGLGRKLISPKKRERERDVGDNKHPAERGRNEGSFAKIAAPLGIR